MLLLWGPGAQDKPGYVVPAASPGVTSLCVWSRKIRNVQQESDDVVTSGLSRIRMPDYGRNWCEVFMIYVFRLHKLILI